MKKKNVWLAVIANVIVPGLGYIYLGRRKIFGLLLLLTLPFIVISFVQNNEPWALIFENGMWYQIASLISVIAFGYDAYSEAKVHNLNSDINS